MRVEIRRSVSPCLAGGTHRRCIWPTRRGQRYKIQYDHQTYHMDNGQPLTEEDVSSTQLRPTPPLVNSEKHTYSVGDAVEVYDNDCWWLGTVIQVLHVAKLSLIHIPYTGRLNTFHLSKLRHCQQWSKGKWSQLYFYSQQSRDIIYDGSYPMSENSGQSSVASSPGDIQTDAESQPQPEEEVNKQRRQCDLIERRATLEAQACSNFLNANQIVKDSRRSEFSNDRNALKNVEALSQRTISLASLLKGVKKRCIHDDKRHGTCSGNQHRKYNNVKRFKNRDPAEAMEERVKTHEMELQAYRCVLKAIYAHNQSFLISEHHCLLTNLRIELHITGDENTHELERVTFQS